ncbi:MAG TPA: hypothetical protein H9976_07680 [Candidatus Akkermansia intestinavium]|nr:hypothetical protein [Candidatus Akkermansia intestinavium]
MKKTLTIMMTAAAALLALSSCNDSDSNSSNSAASTVAIPVDDFASGAVYYESVSAPNVRLKANLGGGGTPNGNQVTVSGELSVNGTPYNCKISYITEGSQNAPVATCAILFESSPKPEDADLLDLWSISAPADANEADVQADLEFINQNGGYYITISFPSGNALFTTYSSDSETFKVIKIGAPKSLVFQVKTDQSASAGDSAGDGSADTSIGN